MESSKKIVILSVALVLILIFYTVLMSIGTQGTGTHEWQQTSESDFTILSPQTGNRVLLHSYDAAEIVFPFTKNPPAAEAAANAADGKCLYIGPEKVNESEEIKQYPKGHSKAEHPGFFKIPFKVPADDQYDLWIRAYWVDDCGDSVYVTIKEVDGAEQPLAVISGSTHKRWTWNALKDRGSLVLIPLKKDSSYELIFCNREDDLYIDQILLRGYSRRNWPEPTGIEK